jgi:hypothetical protein
MNAMHSRIGSALVVLAAALALGGGGGCNTGQEGERCNPNLTHDECGAGLACSVVPDCPETYCCPTSGNSSNVYCQSGCNGGLAAMCAAGADAADCFEGGSGDDGGSPGDDGGSTGGDGGAE